MLQAQLRRELRDAFLWAKNASPGKGFERFYPKNSSQTTQTKNSSLKGKTSNTNSNSESSSNKFNSSNNNNNNNNSNKNNKKKWGKKSTNEDKKKPWTLAREYALPISMGTYFLYTLASSSSSNNSNTSNNYNNGSGNGSTIQNLNSLPPSARYSRGLPTSGNLVPIDFHTFATKLLPTSYVSKIVVTAPHPSSHAAVAASKVKSGNGNGNGEDSGSVEITATVIMKEGFNPGFLGGAIQPLELSTSDMSGDGDSGEEVTTFSTGPADEDEGGISASASSSPFKDKQKIFQGMGVMDLLTASPDKINEIKRKLEMANKVQGGSGSGGSNSSSNSNSNRTSYVFTIGSVDSFERSLELHQTAAEISMANWVPVAYTVAPPAAPEESSPSLVREVVKSVAPSLLLGAAFYFALRMLMGGKGPMGGGGGGSGGGGGPMGGMFSMGKSKAKKINPETIEVTFKDVAGCDLAKKEVMEFVTFLSEPDAFTRVGAKVPKGALLSGPPGTGKTLLAKAVAGEASVPFYSISGSDFIEMFVGVGPSRVRDLFATARADAPCIIFIDEIDAVGRQRGKGGNFSGGNDERENTLNQLLVEMDGFEDSAGVVVLAGTNRPDVLDKALLRPGRFDRSITIEAPDIKGRKDIFKVHLQNIVVEGGEEGIDAITGRLAGLTPGFAGADIANMCNEAAINAGRRKGESVTLADFEEAVDRVLGGLASPKLLSQKEKKIVAYHEAGHAICGWFLEHADPLVKVTIIPRGSGALGYAQYLPKEVSLRTREEMLDIVCMALGGRAAEQVIFGKVTNGASNDLQKVTGIVYNLIRSYGMGDTEDGIGQLSYPVSEGAFGSNQSGTVPYSNETAERMDREAKSIVDEAYRRTISLVEERKEELVKVAEMLIEKETISHDDVFELIGARGFAGESDAAYQEFVHSTSKFGGGGAAAAGEDGGEEGGDRNNENDNKEEVPPLNLTPA